MQTDRIVPEHSFYIIVSRNLSGYKGVDLYYRGSGNTWGADLFMAERLSPDTAWNLLGALEPASKAHGAPDAIRVTVPRSVWTIEPAVNMHPSF